MNTNEKINVDVNLLIEAIRPGIAQVIEKGMLKHGHQSWMRQDNEALKHKNNVASMQRHLSQFSVEPTSWNEEEQCLHLTNVIVRAAMATHKLKEGTYE